ncbi:hypothetical protein EVAR_82647_1 [Eumeta japonica]|uniref:Integrase catalytic domain-containing protein n=1 Tax=Eumeta variegata TaxID=151549 RepID=A0A4C1VAM1_EUMVA|nr:hypothetical protein EVAR_82647_1 [Eumeta japonica]
MEICDVGEPHCYQLDRGLKAGRLGHLKSRRERSACLHTAFTVSVVHTRETLQFSDCSDCERRRIKWITSVSNTRIGLVSRKTALSISPVCYLLKNNDGTYTYCMSTVFRSSKTTFTPDEEFAHERLDGDKNHAASNLAPAPKSTGLTGEIPHSHRTQTCSSSFRCCVSSNERESQLFALLASPYSIRYPVPTQEAWKALTRTTVTLEPDKLTEIQIDSRGILSKHVREFSADKLVVVKAVHLELVTDLSTETFILALRRFMSRRGKPREIYCDNGTNFIGANRAIRDLASVSGLVNEGIKFHHSPAYSPHFGGLYESAVKSAKFHMKRVLGNTHLTYEELSTLFVQIEAILNSIPLVPMSPDPNNFSPLTPGHFLIGRPLTSLPSPDFQDANPSHLHRYAQISQSREYVCELQQRTKWQHKQPDNKPDQMVLIRGDSTPPMKWPLGRVTVVYPGSDGVGRVAEIKTSKGVVL